MSGSSSSAAYVAIEPSARRKLTSGIRNSCSHCRQPPHGDALIPIAAIALALVPRYVRESKAEGLRRHFDSFGAVTVTGSLMLLVFALTQANRVGWGSTQTIGVFVASAVLMAVFLWNETRSRSPLVPLSIFKVHQRSVDIGVVADDEGIVGHGNGHLSHGPRWRRRRRAREHNDLG